jgi:hypothetical protein
MTFFPRSHGIRDNESQLYMFFMLWFSVNLYYICFLCYDFQSDLYYVFYVMIFSQFVLYMFFKRNFEELKPASHVPILGTILNIFDIFVAVFFSPLNSLNLVKRLITSRYLFLCEWICLSVLFMFFTSGIFVAPLESNYGWLEFFPRSHGIRDNESQLYMFFMLWFSVNLYSFKTICSFSFINLQVEHTFDKC